MTPSSRSLALLASACILGCAATRTLPDAGPAFDVGTDAAPTDAPCACDDGIACTFDSCDRSGRCVHWSNCPGNEVCTLREGAIAVCETGPSCDATTGCPSFNCVRFDGCLDHVCRYTWRPDFDGDGVDDIGCGGTDCQPADPSIPGVETCNGIDDDCNAVVDDIPGSDTDPLNCGQCGGICAGPVNACVDGVCVCAASRTECGINNCVSLDTDPTHCGDCETRCFDGSRCVDGRCEYRASWSISLDAPFADAPLVGPNGEMLLLVSGRPTRIEHHDGSPTDDIPPGPSPFPLHAIRLDRAGHFIGITSLPGITVEPSKRAFAMTSEGFYFAGNVREAGTYFGTDFPMYSAIVGYVPRGSSEVEWVALEPAVTGVASTAGGNGVVLTYVDVTSGQLVILDSEGTRLPIVPRLNLDQHVMAIWGRPEGGWLLATAHGPLMLPGVPLSGPERHGSSLILVDESGLITEEISTGMDVHFVFDERPDGNSWLAAMAGGEIAIELSRTESRYLGRGDQYSAMFDGRGMAYMGTGTLHRVRDEVEVARIEIPGMQMVHSGSAWFVTTEGSISTFSRIDIPPLP